MNHETILVLGTLTEPLLSRLKAHAGDMNLVVGSTLEDFKSSIADATVILGWEPSRDPLRQVLSASPNVRWVHIRWAGLDGVFSPELVDSSAVLTNGRGVFSPSLGEWVLGAIFYFAKDFRRLIRSQMDGIWDCFNVARVSGATVGIIGYGDIGRAVATRASALGMRVFGLTRRGPVPGLMDDVAEEIFAPSDRIRMIRQCDYVVVSAPLTPDTRGMIGDTEFAAMKPEAVVINVGRGPVISERALIRALSEGRIKGAALDVFDQEPLPSGHPFYSMENVLLSPHCADNTHDWVENAMDFFLENLDRYRKGQRLLNVVKKERGY